VRDHGTLVVGQLDPASAAVAERVAGEHHATLLRAPADAGVPLRAPGGFQRRNFAMALATADAFLGPGELRAETVAAAAAQTTVPGRIEVVAERPMTVYDGAHNPAGARALAESLDDVLGARRPRVGAIGVLEDKDAAGMLRELLPQLDRVVFTRSRNPRSLSPATLASLAEQLGGPPAEIVADPHAALERAQELAGAAGAVLATGSIYLIADLVRDAADRRASTM
jgi:dihydrofolate synthase / folylpolyglutamate synthase